MTFTGKIKHFLFRFIIPKWFLKFVCEFPSGESYVVYHITKDSEYITKFIHIEGCGYYKTIDVPCKGYYKLNFTQYILPAGIYQFYNNGGDVTRKLCDNHHTFIITPDKRRIDLRNPQEAFDILNKYSKFDYKTALNLVKL